MKISSMVLIALMIGGVMLGFSTILNELKVNYIDSNLTTVLPVNSSYTSNLNYSDKIETPINEFMEKVNDTQNEEIGWFGRITSGMELIPQALISLLSLLLSTYAIFTNYLNFVSGTFGIPPLVTRILVLGFFVFIGFKFIGAIRRHEA